MTDESHATYQSIQQSISDLTRHLMTAEEEGWLQAHSIHKELERTKEQIHHTFIATFNYQPR